MSSSEQPPAPPAPTPPPSKRYRVLVADDEDLVRNVVRRCLRQHDVEDVETGVAVLVRLDGGAAYDAIFLDMQLGESSGIEVYHAICERHPSHSSRVVFMTGDPTNDRVTAFFDATSLYRLDKPFGALEVRQLLDRVVSKP